MKSTNKLLIGIAGCSRVGKNTLDEHIKTNYCPDYKVGSFSFAHTLKRDLQQFCLDNFNIDSFTEDTKQKEIIRPLMVAYGECKRKISKGTFWWKKLKPEIDTFFMKGGDIAIITDLRFCEFDEDECHFVDLYSQSRQGMSSINVYLERDDVTFANESERQNLPRVKEKADLVINWPKTLNFQQRELYLDGINGLYETINKRLTVSK